MVRTHESKIAQRSSEIEEARERMAGLQSRATLKDSFFGNGMKPLSEL